MKNSILKGLPSTIVTVILLHASLGVDAGIQCWTNKEGVHECGDVVPPEYAQQTHREISQGGIAVESTPHAKTKGAMEGTKPLASMKVKQKRPAKDAAIEYRMHRDTFTIEDELTPGKDPEVQTIESNIEHAHMRLTAHQQTVAKLQTEAARLERGGESVSEKLRMDIAEAQRQIEKNRRLIEMHR